MGWPKLDMEELNDLYVDLFMYLIEGMGFDIWTGPLGKLNFWGPKKYKCVSFY